MNTGSYLLGIQYRIPVVVAAMPVFQWSSLPLTNETATPTILYITAETDAYNKAIKVTDNSNKM